MNEAPTVGGKVTPEVGMDDGSDHSIDRTTQRQA